MADTKQVNKRNFFRFSKASPKKAKSPPKDGNRGGVAVSSKELGKRPRFSSLNNGPVRPSVLKLFNRNAPSNPATGSRPSGGAATRPSILQNLARFGRKSKANNPASVIGKPLNGSARRSTTGLYNLLGGKTSNVKQGVHSVTPARANRSKWEIRYTLSGRKYFWNKEDCQHYWTKPTELQSKVEIENAGKDWVWVPHPKNYWQPAIVVSTKQTGGVQVRLLMNHKLVNIPGVKVMRGPLTAGEQQRVPLTPLNPSLLDNIVDDLIELEEVNEGTLLHNTRLRYEGGDIYTWIGPSMNVLLAINPYEDPGLYTEEYKKKYETSATSLDTPKPHVFGVAATCVHKLAAQGKSQSILVSGESGSGKTMATKQCLDFITHIAGSTKVMPEKPKPTQRAPGKNGRQRTARRNRKKKREQKKRGMPGQGVKMVNAGQSNSVEDKILRCNPIMEAFGNAKTVRNNNSSRFGKWIVMYMDMKKKQVKGAKIEQFLLETTRVISQAENERNYHAFYQVFADPELKEKYDLTDPKDFFYVNQGKCFTVEGERAIDDAKELEDVRLAMEKLDFAEEEKEWFYKIVCALLHLGNVNFESVDNVELKSSGSTVKSDDNSVMHLQKAAEILEIDAEKLVPVLTTRTIRTSKDSTTKTLTAKLATTARDSLAKAIYGRLFSYLIERINESFQTQTVGRFIGILDIFGFESFEYNSFEQLCINFTNERLQKLFNSSTFVEEQDLYKMEKIDYQKIAFVDNQAVLDIIDTRPIGIFNLLDDECNVPKGNTMNFLKKVNNYHNSKMKVFKCDQEKGTFEIKHFADDVVYHVSDFMVKNVDNLNADLYEVCSQSEDKFTNVLFPPLKDDEKVSTKSTSGKFREQLTQLISVLEETHCHFIRCIKPNDEQTPKNFNGRKVINQFKFSAIQDAVETKKKGFAHQMFHEDFFSHYKCVNGFNFNYDTRKDMKRLCKDLLVECFQVSYKNLPEGIQVGEARVFFKTEEYKFLELSKTLAVLKHVKKVQAAYRGRRARKFYAEFKTLGKELEEAVEQKDLDRVLEIEHSLVKRLGKHGEAYNIASRDIANARKKISQATLWDPLKKKLEKYDLINITRGEDGENEIDEEIIETLDEEEMQSIIKSILETEKKGKMPFEIKHSLKRITTLCTIVHNHNLNKQFAEMLKLDAEDSSDDIENFEDDVNKRKTLRQTEMKSGIMVKVDSPEEFAKKDMSQTVNYIENEGKNAIEELDREVLNNVAVRAAVYEYTSPTVEKINMLLKLPEIEFMKRKVELLKKRGDKVAVFEMLMQVKEAELIERFDDFKSFCNLSTLRNPPEEVNFTTCFCIPWGSGVREQSNESAFEKYGTSAKNRMINKKRKFLVWQHDDFLYFSLLRLPEDVEDIAFRCFEQVFAFMEEYRSDDDGLDLIKTGVFMGGGNNPGLRNEIFTQIVKQLTNNPTPESRIRGVELLGLCLASFPPDDEEFKNFLFTWMRLHLPYTIFRNYMAAHHTLLVSSNPNSPTYNGANPKIKENYDLSEIRLLLDDSRENSRMTMRDAPDKWMIPNGLLKNILSDYDVDDEFYDEVASLDFERRSSAEESALLETTVSTTKKQRQSKTKKRTQISSAGSSSAPLARIEMDAW